MNDLIRQIPDRLLERRRGAQQGQRARELEDWCIAHRFRPAFTDLDAERRRRGLATDWPQRNRKETP